MWMTTSNVEIIVEEHRWNIWLYWNPLLFPSENCVHFWCCVGDGAMPPASNHERHGCAAWSGAVSATAFGRAVDDGDPEHGGPYTAFESPCGGYPFHFTMPCFIVRLIFVLPWKWDSFFCREDCAPVSLVLFLILMHCMPRMQSTSKPGDGVTLLLMREQECRVW